MAKQRKEFAAMSVGRWVCLVIGGCVGWLVGEGGGRKRSIWQEYQIKRTR
jgi:hypothetical protein